MAFFSNDDDEIKSELRAINKRLDEQDTWYKEYQYAKDEIKSELRAINKRLDEQDTWYKECQYAKDELDAFKDFTESLEAEKEQLISKINLQHAVICRLRRKIEKNENSNKDDEVFLKLN